MKERQVKGEKGTMVIVATALMTAGIEALSRHDYINGATFILTSILVFYSREHLKFRRWSNLERG